ncbi:MAG: aryl-sulfate sulfotransferase, partial [Deltaproteobacteria bacterium]|nr:aryl-sulfate sulfotransferase [Deltaproteobacteria bacterium]
DADADADTDADTDTDTDTGTDTGEEWIPLKHPIREASARLHDTIRSVVYVSWTQVEEADTTWVEYSFDAGVWLSTPVSEAGMGAHEQIVLGVPYGETVTWRVAVRKAHQVVTSGEETLAVGSLPSSLPLASVSVSEADELEPTGNYLITSVTERNPLYYTDAHFWLVIVDRQGRVVWALACPRGTWTFFAKPSHDGAYLLWDESYYWTSFGGSDDGVVNQMKLDGEIVHSWATPNLHHSFDDLDANTIIWNNLEDHDDVVYLSEGEAPMEQVWSCLDWIFEEDLGLEANPANEECAANAISWNEDSHTVLLSIWTHEIVLELDPSTGEVLWYADPNRGLGYQVTPEEARWMWQHEPVLLSDGNLLLSCGVYDGAPGWTYDHTAAFEYTIDHDAQVIELVWSYLSERSWVFAYRGGAERLPDGNTLHFYGDVGGVRELNPAGDVVWELTFTRAGGDAWVGRSRLVEDLYPLGP